MCEVLACAALPCQERATASPPAPISHPIVWGCGDCGDGSLIIPRSSIDPHSTCRFPMLYTRQAEPYK
jgi:hypothetical protein